MAGMERKLDLTGKKVSKTVQEYRKPSFTEMQYRRRENSSGRQHTGNMSEVAQVRTPSSSESVSRDGKPALARQRWKATRGDSSATPNPSESPRYRLRSQGNEVESRPNEQKSTRYQLRKLKGGGGPGEETSKQQEETAKQKRDKAHDDAYREKKYMESVNDYIYKRNPDEDRYQRNADVIEDKYDRKVSEANEEYNRSVKD
jgi:hypothetical protein